MKLTLIFFLSLIVLNYSCKEYPCSEAIININIKGFTQNEFDSLIIRKYTKSTNFGSLLDSTVIDSLKLSYSWSGDYFAISPNFGNDYGIKSKFDYEIDIPQKNRVFKITEINEKMTSSEVGILSYDRRGCTNPIDSYKINGQLVLGETYFIDLSK